jgi:hypothetical protein
MELAPTTTSDNQYRRALRSLRAARRWFSALLFLMLLIDLGAIATVWTLPQFADSPSVRALLADRGRAGAPNALRRVWRGRGAAATASAPAGESADANAAAAPAAATMPAAMSGAAPTTMPASAPASRPAESRTELAFTLMSLAMPFALSLGVVILIVAMQVLMLLTVLVGKIGDAGSMASALAWSLVLAAVMVPWKFAFGSAIVPGALFLRNELITATASVTWGAHPDWADQVWYWTRFGAYPVAALLVWLLVSVKSSAGVRQPSIRAD